MFEEVNAAEAAVAAVDGRTVIKVHEHEDDSMSPDVEYITDEIQQIFKSPGCRFIADAPIIKTIDLKKEDIQEENKQEKEEQKDQKKDSRGGDPDIKQMSVKSEPFIMPDGVLQKLRTKWDYVPRRSENIQT